MRRPSLAKTFIQTFTFMFIWVQALPAYSSDMSLGIQNGGAPVSTASGGQVAGSAAPDTGGLPGQREKIRAAVEKIKAWHAEVIAVPATAGVANLAQIQTAFEKYDSKYDLCISSQAAASKVCLEQTSPKLQETLNAVNVIISGLSSVAVNDACSTIAKALDVAKMGLTMYTATCGALRGTCELLCSSSVGGLTALKAATDAATPTCIPEVMIDPSAAARCSALMGQFAGLKENLIAAIAPEAVPANPKSIAGKSKLCTYSYADLLLSAGAGIFSIINSAKQANKCNQDTAAADAAAAALVPTDLAVKCAMEQYKATEECVCYFNPRLTGCANSLEKMNSTSDNSMGSAVGAARSPTSTVAGLNAEDNATQVTGGTGSGDSGGGPGAPAGGGGSGLSGGSSSGDGMNRGNSGAGHSGLDANILSGTGGGGGGGGGWGSRGGSADNGRYREYLPGGKKDPNALAGQEARTKEVTGQGGKSNWEKVRERYIDNKGSLLGN